MSKIIEVGRDNPESIEILEHMKNVMKEHNLICKLSHHPLHIDIYYKDILLYSDSVLSSRALSYTYTISSADVRNYLSGKHNPMIEAWIRLMECMNHCHVEFKIVRHTNHYYIYYNSGDNSWFYNVYTIK